MDYSERIRNPKLLDKIKTPQEAAALIRDGMTVGMSGFTKAGDAKVVPLALAERAKTDSFQINLWTGASIGDGIDGILADAGVISRRLPFQSDAVLRKAINRGDVMFVDQHLSQTVEMIRAKEMGKIDVALVEALAINENGSIVPTTSIGNSATYAILADQIIVEINLSQPLELEGIHDVYIPTYRPARSPIPILRPEERIGIPSIPIDPDRIAAIVITEQHDSASSILPTDEDSRLMAGHLLELLKHEVNLGRMDRQLFPLQSGIGTTANAVLHGLLESPFYNLKMYSEVLQDAVFELLDSGRMVFASASSITLSKSRMTQFLQQVEHYKSKLVLRPQEMSNHPEVIRRLGVIAINTALEADIYGNVNSTHVMGSQMMNGIGGSGDFARNACLSIFVTKSIAKNGSISSIVPMVTHVDHTEHDVDVLVTEQGIADLRGLAPRERAPIIIENCCHPRYRDLLRDYFRDASRRGGHTPHDLAQAYAWHLRYLQNGDMNE